MFSKRSKKNAELQNAQRGDTQPIAPGRADTEVLNRQKLGLFGEASYPVITTLGGGTHTGRVREHNEDHYLVVRRRRSRHVLMTNLPSGSPQKSEEDAFVLCVADGIGGGAFGEMASRLALETGWELGGDEINWPFRFNSDEIQGVLKKIELYPLLIHKQLIREAQHNPQYRGMGTTFTAAYIAGRDAFITHVGDSRAILIRDGSLEQLTTDQTLAEYYLKHQAETENGPSSDELKRFSHVLISCLGAVDDNVEVQTRHINLKDGDALLLCSDGLTDMVDNDTIARIVTEIDDPQQTCDQLIELALAAGGRDNVTVVIGKIEIPTEQPTTLQETPTPPA